MLRIHGIDGNELLLMDYYRIFARIFTAFSKFYRIFAAFLKNHPRDFIVATRSNHFIPSSNFLKCIVEDLAASIFR